MMWNLELGAVFGGPLVVIALGWWMNSRYDAELARDREVAQLDEIPLPGQWERV